MLCFEADSVVNNCTHYSFFIIKCTVNQKKKRNTFINSKINCRGEIKLVPINMHYYALQIDALKFFFGVGLHKGSLPNFNFSNVQPLNLTTKS